MNSPSTRELASSCRPGRRSIWPVLLFALTPICALAQMTVLGGNLYVGNENSWIDWWVEDIDGIDPVTIREPLTLPGTVYVSKDAYNDPARLTIRAPLTSAVGYVGYSPNGEGYATVNGPAGSWTTTGVLYIGHSGRGWFRIERGGTVDSVGASVGTGYYGPGLATVTGAGSRWTNVGEFFMGWYGGGKFYVDDRAVVTSTGPIYVGSGDGVTDRVALHVRGAGQLVTGDAFLTGGRTEAFVQGAGSLWLINGALALGLDAKATLLIDGGGTVVSSNASLGVSGLGDGWVTVTGAGSRWEDFGTIEVGTGGTGTLLVTAGGAVDAGSLHIGAKGKAVLRTGGTLDAPVRLDGGRLKLQAAANPFGTLDVDTDSVLEYAGSAPSEAAFEVSAAQAWGGTLTITGYVAGFDSLRVGAGTDGLTAGQLAKIFFADYGAFAQIGADGYVTPAGF